MLNKKCRIKTLEQVKRACLLDPENLDLTLTTYRLHLIFVFFYKNHFTKNLYFVFSIYNRKIGIHKFCCLNLYPCLCEYVLSTISRKWAISSTWNECMIYIFTLLLAHKQTQLTPIWKFRTQNRNPYSHTNYQFGTLPFWVYAISVHQKP